MTQQDQALSQLCVARQALSQCRTAMESKRIMDAAEAARIYLERTKASVDTVNEATEVRLMAERQMGEFLKNAPKHDGGRPLKTGRSGRPVSQTLEEMGISKDESSRSQRLAVMSEEEFQRRIEDGKQAGKLTLKAVLDSVPRTHEVSENGHIQISKPLMAPSLEAQNRGAQAEKDGEKLWQLKSWWRQANQKERKAFLQWIKEQE